MFTKSGNIFLSILSMRKLDFLYIEDPLIADKKLLIKDEVISGENRTGQTLVFMVFAPSLAITRSAAFSPICLDDSNASKSLVEEYQ